MDPILLDGKSLSDNLFIKLKENFGDQCKDCKLIILTVGDNPASKVYVRNKIRACERVGIKHEHLVIDENISDKDFIDLLTNLMLDNQKNTGIILQLPAPANLVDIFDKVIEGRYGVDGFDFTNKTLLYAGEHPFYYPATPKGIMLLLDNYNIQIEGKHVVIIGRSEIVGKPLAKLMLDEDATVTVCHSKTQNLEQITSSADILVVAVGKPNFITSKYIKEGAVIIDVGINRLESGSICGDVNFSDVREKCYAITPVPGGVGPMTVYSLIENTLYTSLYCEKK